MGPAGMYHGNQASRDLIFDTEFYFFDEAGAVVPGATKFHVLVTTYELVSKDLPRLAQLDFEVLVLDEGHRAGRAGMVYCSWKLVVCSSGSPARKKRRPEMCPMGTQDIVPQ